MQYLTQINLLVPVDWKQQLSQLAQERTIDGARRATLSDLVREAMDNAYGLSRCEDGPKNHLNQKGK